jgi:anti-anti-sigma factor
VLLCRTVDSMDKTSVYKAVQATLRQHIFQNAGTLPPMQLSRIGTTIVDLLLADTLPTREQIEPISKQGLGLGSLVAAIVALARSLEAQGDSDGAYHMVLDRLMPTIVLYSSLDIEAVRLEQEAMRTAVTLALSEQRQEASRLVDLLDEVSTPIVPVYDGILVLPLIGAIDSRRSNAITERLLQSIIQLRAHSIIIDVTGVPIIDTAVAQHLIQTVQSAQLLGTQVILVGINPEMAQTVVQLGINIGSLITLSNLQSGIRYVLRRHNLAIGPIAPRP